MPGLGAVRWGIKKAARRGVAIGSVLTGCSRRSAGALRILTYHRFDGEKRNPFSVDPDAFDRQMAWVSRHRHPVSLDAVVDFVNGRRTVPDGAVLVTIDDGCGSVMTGALPVLRRYGIPAVVFLPVGLIGDPAAEQLFGEPTIGWPEVARLADAGISIGAHGWSHRSLGRMPAAEVQSEAMRARNELEQHLRIPVRAFAYPFGTLADFNAETTYALREAGYDVAFTSQHGSVGGAEEPFLLGRIKVEGGEGEWMFRQLCAGGLDGWGVVDRVLWRLQASPGGT